MSIYGNPVMLGGSGGGGGGTIVSKIITANGTYNASADNADGYDPVIVNVPGGSHILCGTGLPSASEGENGDIYIREFALPSNVNFVDYLLNSGTQWIETGLTGNQNTSVFVDQYWTGVPAVQARYSATSRNIGVGSQTGGILSVDFGTTRNTVTPTSGSRVTAVSANLFREYNGTILGTSIESAFITPSTFRLFAINATNSYGFVISNGAKLCRVVIKQSGVTIKDYLPALDGNGVACMWEAVAGEYVYNSGTGTFTPGSTVNPVPTRDIYLKTAGVWNIMLQHA